MGEGRCKILPDSIHRLNKVYSFGRCRVFKYKQLGAFKVLVYREGLKFVISKEDFIRSFATLK